MTPAELEKFLYEQIPLATALEIAVVHADDTSAEVKAPLYPNRNHMGTAFGGSLNAVMVLAGYAWLFQCMESRGHRGHVVLKESTIQYLLPVASDFSAVAKGPTGESFEKFLDGFERKGRSRVHVAIEVDTPSGVACRLNCEFVAKRADQAEVD
ncbi:thioesterase domain-containing protein [soil metagenome]